jgi:hypothetical protein
MSSRRAPILASCEELVAGWRYRRACFGDDRWRDGRRWPRPVSSFDLFTKKDLDESDYKHTNGLDCMSRPAPDCRQMPMDSE